MIFLIILYPKFLYKLHNTFKYSSSILLLSTYYLPILGYSSIPSLFFIFLIKPLSSLSLFFIITIIFKLPVLAAAPDNFHILIKLYIPPFLLLLYVTIGDLVILSINLPLFIFLGSLTKIHPSIFFI